MGRKAIEQIQTAAQNGSRYPGIQCRVQQHERPARRRVQGGKRFPAGGAQRREMQHGLYPGQGGPKPFRIVLSRRLSKRVQDEERAVGAERLKHGPPQPCITPGDCRPRHERASSIVDVVRLTWHKKEDPRCRVAVSAIGSLWLPLLHPSIWAAPSARERAAHSNEQVVD
jgi:hypothetical protein